MLAAVGQENVPIGERPLKMARLEKLRVQLDHPDAKVPKRGSEHAAGYDLSRYEKNIQLALATPIAALEFLPPLCSCEDTVVPARGKACVKTGIRITVPSGTYGRVAPRSGLAVKNFIDVGAGVIDEDYTGLVGVVLFNHSETDFQGRHKLMLRYISREPGVHGTLQCARPCNPQSPAQSAAYRMLKTITKRSPAFNSCYLRQRLVAQALTPVLQLSRASVSMLWQHLLIRLSVENVTGVCGKRV